MMKQMQTVIVLLLALCVAAVSGRAELNNPYEILHKHYEAIGGLEKLKAQKTSYLEGTVVLEGTGLEGTFIQWSESPIRNRQEADLGVIKQVSGDNGEFSWTVDHNGKLQVNRDEKTLKERRVQILLAEYDHLNRDSKNFTLGFEGVEALGDTGCYVVKMTNSINDDIAIQYYDTSSFYLIKTVDTKPDMETRTLFSDYREVNGVLFAFTHEATVQPPGLKQILQFTKVEMDIPIDASLFEPPTEDIEDFHFVNGKSAENIPFQFIENHIYLPITVGGKTRVWVLDSGAGATVIEEKFAAELELETEGELKGQGAGNLVDFSFATLPAFSLTGIEFTEQKAVVAKLNWLFQKSVGFDVAGILGYDFLSRLVTKIDYANETISFYHPDSFTYTGPGTVIEVPISQSNMFHVPLTVDGKYGGLWNLDLGAGGTSFHYPFAEEHGLLDLAGVDGLGFGAGGPLKRCMVQFHTIEFAGFVNENPLITITLEKGEGAFASKELTGNIGNTLLRHFVLYLDYKREQVIVEKGDDFDRVFPHNNSGIQVVKSENDEMEVLFVADNTPGAKAGFQVGDIIQSVNGIDVDHLNGIVALKKLLREEPGTKYTVSVVREGKPKTLKLTLQDLHR